MKKLAVLAAALLVGGCALDGQKRSTGVAGSLAKSYESDKPKQLCESTLIGSQPKTICY